MIKETTSIESIPFENEYIQLRRKEGRLYSDHELLQLPDIPAAHPLYHEWNARKRSCRKLITHLNKKNKFLHVLDVGCGNGWFTAQLAAAIPGYFIGLDINSAEVEQADKVFRHLDNIQFIKGDLRDHAANDKKFDAIVLASSIQYFSSFGEIIDCALRYLAPQGEIHILDSPFYTPGQIEEARQRSLNHFKNMGSPAMAKFYYHHSIEELKKYQYQVIYNPHALINKLTATKNVFYHFCITGTKPLA